MGILLIRRMAEGSAILGVLAMLTLLPALPSVPACPFRMTTGIPCPTCGVTRGVFALLHGDFLHAVQMNPLSVVVVVVLLRRLLVLTAAGTRLSSYADSPTADRVLIAIFFSAGIIYYFGHTLPVALAARLIRINI